MARTLVTGATGLLGSHLVRALADRGDELRLLIKRGSDTAALDGIDYEEVTGDVTDRRAVRRAVEGVERVFHVAAESSLDDRDRELVFAVNVGGTRLVADEALAAGVGRLVHTSSVAAIGPAAKGGRADETQPFMIAHLGIAYANSKHEAEAEVLRAAARGLDAVIVNPTFTLGPPIGATSSMSIEVVRRFLQRRIPAYVDGGLNVVDVRDVAAGELLADEKGRRGERYILGGRNFTLQRLFADLSRISGVPVPPLRLPPRIAVGAAELSDLLHLGVGIGVDEARSAALWWTYSSAKAKRELGFAPRPHEETLEATLTMTREQLGGRIGTSPGPAGALLEAVGRAGRVAGRFLPR
ncbi:MAG TPA: NAD-dependent epimerase/dehydratase family protein [Solirubrobacterales bacterium]|jgi:dihydroflavonol-4-reductase|nr:NAD-dependent epimerase/dehydratase family protein [Solirubrobacterales bacterium]